MFLSLVPSPNNALYWESGSGRDALTDNIPFDFLPGVLLLILLAFSEGCCCISFVVGILSIASFPPSTTMVRTGGLSKQTVTLERNRCEREGLADSSL